MTNDHYICQRAANAILSEIGPYQISSDALQSVNQFLDQCLFLVLQNATSLDLSHLKAQLLTLLPLRLGRNAMVEAELEVKAYSDVNDVDTSLYEQMRSLPNPVDQIWASLRTQCLKQCALADKSTVNDDDLHEHDLVFSPIVIIFVTAVLEHIAEYILTTIAITAKHQGSDYIRVKEVYWALMQDTQVGGLFKQTDMRLKLEKRVMSSYSSPHYQQPPEPEYQAKPPMSMPRDTFDHRTPELYSDLDDDDDDDDDDEILPSSHTARTSSSIKSGQSISSYRPISVLSNGTTATNRSTSSSKKAFRFFGKKGKKRSSVASHSTTGTTKSMQQERTISPDSPSSVQIYDIDTPALDFEDLIRSGNTMKVSLTPNRLRSIEIKSSSPATPRPPPPTNAPFENPRAAPKPPINEKSASPPMTPNSSIASRISNPRSSPPAALQLTGHKFHESQNSVDTADVCAMDLPSPPSTIDRHPSPIDRSDARQHFDRPSTIVAKRASGRARPASYHENFALTIEQRRSQQQQNTLSLSTRTNDTVMRGRRPFSQIITEEEDTVVHGECIHPSLISLANMDCPVPLQDKDTVASIDAAIQTDPLPGIPSLASLLAARSRQLPVPTLIITEDDEQGLVDGDEEWFIQDWDDAQDSAR